jgi:biotin carboxyl carrier protein
VRVSNSEAAIAALGDGAFRITRSDGTQTIAYGVADGARTWVFLDGVTHVIEPPRQSRQGAGHDDAALAAPMPATVTQIHVAIGQVVAPADLLVTLEAMKMELPVRAIAAGTVSAINCRVGELVQPGAPLVEMASFDSAGGPDGGRPASPDAARADPESEPRHEPRSNK